MTWLLYLLVCLADTATSTFSPSRVDYDAYGLKIAINDVFFVEARNSIEKFLVQFAPYDYQYGSLQCSLDFGIEAGYIYSVGIGLKQNSTTNPYFYFSGTVLPTSSSLFNFGPSSWSSGGTDKNQTFIGIYKNNDSQNVQDYLANRTQPPCNLFIIDRLEYLTAYGYQEHFVMAVEPYGQYAIGLATDFVFLYQPYFIPTMTTESTANVWPNNSAFIPCAADISESDTTVVAGFRVLTDSSGEKVMPSVFLMRNSNLTVVSSWSYTAPSNSWQAALTYSNIKKWSSQYTMSVKINSHDQTRVLVGMPFLNTVFMLVINTTDMSLRLTSSIDNGLFVGFGKSVGWSNDNQAVILAATYSLDFQTPYLSQLYLYASLNGTTLPSSPSAVIPNTQQLLPLTVGGQLIRMVATSKYVVTLDVMGDGMILITTPPGFYASIATGKSAGVATMPLVSRAAVCIGGTFKVDTGIHPCTLCPSGSRNPGNSASTTCLNCSSGGFCPLGALYEVDMASLTSQSQAYAYPRSPESTVFEDILLNNILLLDSTPSCLRISALFWTFVVLLIAVLIVVGMASLNFCVHPSKRDPWRTKIKSVFQRIDLVVSRTTLEYILHCIVENM